MTTMTAADLEEALSAAGLTADVHWSEVTRSTNETALEMARSGAPQWSLAATAHQTAGRGRLGRTWEDAPGRSLMFSVVLRPALPATEVGLLTLLAGAAMAGAASALSGLDVRCKWPNDLVIDAGKVGGVLAESSVEDGVVQHVVVGQGVNLEAPAGIDGAAGLGAGVDEVELLARFLIGFRAGYRPDAPGFAEEVEARWTGVSDTIGRTVEARAVGGALVKGTAVGIDARGGLIVRAAEGPVTVTSGEIEHLR